MRRLLVALTLLCALAGCSRGPRLYKVTGTVTYNGAPLPEGDITFVPEDRALAPEGGKIKDGRFELRAREGKHTVEVSASKIFPGGAKGAGGEPVPEEYVPEEYNLRSKLRAEVRAGGPNAFEFKLEGAKR